MDKVYNHLNVAMFISSATACILLVRYKKRPNFRKLTSGPATAVRPPIAAKHREIMFFGKHPDRPDEFRGSKAMDPPLIRYDDYNWMRDETRKDEKVLGLIREENAYCEQQMADIEPLKKQLYQKMIGYMKESDAEVPYLRGDFYYYTKTVQGLAYKVHCRYHRSLGLLERSRSRSRSFAADEPERFRMDELFGDRSHTVILDENELAASLEYCDVTNLCPSPSQNKLLYGVDKNGSEQYSVYVKDLVIGAQLSDVLTNISCNFVWGNDDSCFFFTKLDDQNRPHEVWLHVLGTPQETDVLVYRENDQLFNVEVRKSISDEYLIIGSYSIETAEERIIRLNGLFGAGNHIQACQANEMIIVQKRVPGLRYLSEHHGSNFYIVTNDESAHNGKLVYLPIDSRVVTIDGLKGNKQKHLAAKCYWKDVRPYNPNVEITEILPFRYSMAILGREDGLKQVWIASSTGEQISDMWARLEFADEIYDVEDVNNYCYDSDYLRLTYSSFVTPCQVIEVSLRDHRQFVLKEQDVPGYDRDKYQCRRIFVPSSVDGAMIPVSLLYLKKQIPANIEDCKNACPLLLHGYGSYGICKEPAFDYTLLPLVDLGIIFSFAHVRGGGEMGRFNWYEKGGKYFTKMNTFTDFIDCAKSLIAMGITTPFKLACSGRSAGGLLIGAVLNLHPSLFRAAIADVPFVDVLNTMTDPNIPLTVQEWEEWGNSNEKDYYDYISKYCPYTNVKSQDYPAMLVTTGLNDPRVQYWEPLKWVSKLRDMKTNKDVPLMLKTDLGSGHFSSSDRYRGLREKSFEMAFIVDQLGMNPFKS